MEEYYWYILTPITAGATTAHVHHQYACGLYPVICSTQLENLVAPNIQPMAIVWKKQHHKIGIPLAL